MRKLTRGVEIGRLRLFWMSKGWNTKPHPYWFARKYTDGTRTFQCMRFELFLYPKPRPLREVSHNQAIAETPNEILMYREVAIGDCDYGCKIYQHQETGEKVLAHNSAYGCRR